MAVFSKLSLQWECQNIHLDQGQLGYMSLQGEYNQHSYDAGGKTNHQVFHTGSLFIHTSHEGSGWIFWERTQLLTFED